MRLNEAHFRDSVTFNGSQTHRLQAVDPNDRRTYAPMLREHAGAVYWSEVDFAPASNVKQARRAPETVTQPADHPEGAAPPKNAEPQKRGKVR